MQADADLRIDAGRLDGLEAYRRRKDTAVLAIVFVDIAESTPLLEELGEIAYDALREEHNERLRKVFERDDVGSVVQLFGDGALAVFSEPSAAVERSLALKQETHKQSPFRLRIGVDLGQVARSRSEGVVTEVFGRQVNRAARIQQLAEPGHALVSFQVYDCAVGWLRGSGIHWARLGTTQLKGFHEAIPLLEALAPEDGDAQALDARLRPEVRAPSRTGRQIVELGAPLPTELVSTELSGAGEAAASSRRVVGELLVVGTSLGGDVYAVYDGVNRIGRSPACEVRLRGAGVADEHAALVHHRGVFTIAPISEESPTLVNGESTRAGEIVSGDYLELGGSKLRLEAMDEWEFTLDDQLRVLEARISHRRGSLRRLARAVLGRPASAPATLWVDPLPDRRQWERETLAALGCEVDTAESPRRAIELLTSRHYDAVVTGLDGPDASDAGLELLEWIRGSSPQTPTLVFASPSAVAENRERAARLGARACTAGSVSLFRALARTL